MSLATVVVVAVHHILHSFCKYNQSIVWLFNQKISGTPQAYSISPRCFFAILLSPDCKALIAASKCIFAAPVKVLSASFIYIRALFSFPVRKACVAAPNCVNSELLHLILPLLLAVEFDLVVDVVLLPI